MKLSRGQIVELDIESAAFGGSSLGRLEGLVVFVRNAVPGDRVRARILRRKKQHAEAVVEELISPSSHRRDPRCPYFGTCGGCCWQNLDYGQQLVFKTDQVKDLFERIGGLENIPIREAMPSPAQYFYRNKMEFSFGASRWLTREEIESGEELQKNFALGLHLPKRYDKILDLEHCYLPQPIAVEILNRVRQLAVEKQWKAYHSRHHTGFLRHLIIRTADSTQQVMVHLVSSRSDPDRLRVFTDLLVDRFPAITTLINTVHSGPGPMNSGLQPTVTHGEGTILERLDGLDFRIAPADFFQPNTAQAEKMYALVREYSQLQGDEVIFDLYCGIGTISLYLARSVQRVVGFENQESAIQNALSNAQANQIHNCSFALADVKDALTPAFIRQQGRPNVIVTDPPRPGMHAQVCRRILQIGPERVVYISCNPATQARDLRLLSKGYCIEVVQPIDLFPHTHHIENIALLRRKTC